MPDAGRRSSQGEGCRAMVFDRLDRSARRCRDPCVGKERYGAALYRGVLLSLENGAWWESGAIVVCKVDV